jgi:hypothetical protein
MAIPLQCIVQYDTIKQKIKNTPKLSFFAFNFQNITSRSNRDEIWAFDMNFLGGEGGGGGRNRRSGFNRTKVWNITRTISILCFSTKALKFHMATSIFKVK